VGQARHPRHLAADILLFAIPGGLALVLVGNAQTAAAGLATAAILTASPITGFGALARGALGRLAPAAWPAARGCLP
jgi:hypothetical protein